MSFNQILQLLFAAATWGASHVFLRIIVPSFGPVLTSFLRMSIGAVSLIVISFIFKNKVNLKKHGKFYLAIGLLNTAIPLTLFSFAAVHLPAAYLIIMNATSPMFSALFSALFLGDEFGIKKAVSLILGICGVILLTQYGSVSNPDSHAIIALFACAVASACYALGGVIVKKNGKGVDPVSITLTSNWLGTLLLLPVVIYSYSSLQPFQFEQHSPQAVLISLLILGIFGTGIAFVVFYRLIPQIGAFKASLVSFLMPVFGFIWGAMFLNEPLTLGTIAGACLVVCSTALFMKKPKPV